MSNCTLLDKEPISVSGVVIPFARCIDHALAEMDYWQCVGCRCTHYHHSGELSFTDAPSFRPIDWNNTPNCKICEVCVRTQPYQDVYLQQCLKYKSAERQQSMIESFKRRGIWREGLVIPPPIVY